MASTLGGGAGCFGKPDCLKLPPLRGSAPGWLSSADARAFPSEVRHRVPGGLGAGVARLPSGPRRQVPVASGPPQSLLKARHGLSRVPRIPMLEP